MTALIRNYTYPEHAAGFFACLKKLRLTLERESTSDAQSFEESEVARGGDEEEPNMLDEEEDATLRQRRVRQRSGFAPRHDGPPSVQEVAQAVRVSTRTIHRWIAEGKLDVRQESGTRMLGPGALDQARKLASARQVRREIMEYSLEQGMSKEAAKKYIQRAVGRGESLKQAATKIIEKLKPV
jgi:hypothetical protein